MNIPNTNESSLLMSESLMGELDLEDDEKKILQDRSCIVVIKTKIDSKNDLLLGHLYSMGIDASLYANASQELFNIEIGIKQQLGIDFLDVFWKKQVTIHGIEIHRGDNIVTLFPERDVAYVCTKCNIFDVSIQNEECTLTLCLLK
jgi:hypothetical protein